MSFFHLFVLTGVHDCLKINPHSDVLIILEAISKEVNFYFYILLESHFPTFNGILDLTLGWITIRSPQFTLTKGIISYHTTEFVFLLFNQVAIATSTNLDTFTHNFCCPGGSLTKDLKHFMIRVRKSCKKKLRKLNPLDFTPGLSLAQQKQDVWTESDN